MRLDRFVSETTGLSRVDAKKVIHAKRVRVDDQVCRDTGYSVREGQQVSLDERPLVRRGPLYLMLNKPEGTVCSHVADGHPSVLSLLPAEWRDGLHIAGRLDQDTTGLVLLTDDGQWSHRITSPRRACTKVYRVGLAEQLQADAEAQCAQGILLKGETDPTLPAQLERLSDTDVRIRIQEGRYHQVKRMFAALGNRVVSLHREQVGAVALDPALAPGEWRELTEDEVRGF